MQDHTHNGEEAVRLVCVVPLPSFPDDIESANVSQVEAMDRFLDECSHIVNSNIDTLLLVNERSFPFSNRLSPIDVAFATRVLMELRQTIGSVQIGIDLVDDAEATFAVATVSNCDFVRVRVAGPYDGLKNPVRADHRTIRELVCRTAGRIETWLAVLPWGERLSATWSLPDLSEVLIETIKPRRITVPISSSKDVLERIGEEKVVFDGGVDIDCLTKGPGTYVIGSALRNGYILNPVDYAALARISKIGSTGS